MFSFKTIKNLAEGAAKNLADGAVQIVQAGQEWVDGDDDDVVLKGFKRLVQLDGYSCGAQSAHAVLRYFGVGRSLKRTARLIGCDSDGTDWAPMKRLFVKRRLGTHRMNRARKRDLKAAIDAGCPVLVAIDDEGHWAVVYGYGSGKVYLADPSLKRAKGNVVFDWSDFKDRWDGWAAVISE